jgi:hypothetical protein
MTTRAAAQQLLDWVWQDGGSIVAVQPRQPFVRYFRTMQRLNTLAQSGVPKADLTGQLLNLAEPLKELLRETPDLASHESGDPSGDRLAISRTVGYALAGAPSVVVSRRSR